MFYCKNIYYGDETLVKRRHTYTFSFTSFNIYCIVCREISYIRTFFNTLTLGFFKVFWSL